MKKILFILFLVFCSFFSKAQFPKPAGVHNVAQFSFFKNNADSTITIYMWSVDLYNTLLSKFDSVKVKGYATNYKLLSYKQIRDSILNSGYTTLWRLAHKLDSILGLAKLRNDSVELSGYFTNYKALQKRSLNNHDSLQFLDERKYQSLTDTLTWGDGLTQSGHVVKADTTFLLKKTTAEAIYEDKQQPYETEVTNGVAVYTVPFILKPSALVIYNYQILPNTRWAGAGTNTLTLYIDPRTNDYLKIQN